MEATGRARVEELMADMAAGDSDAVWQLVDEFGSVLRASVLRLVTEWGRRDVAVDESEIQGLVCDVALMLFERASAWDPEGGALPWTWAERAIRSLVAAHLGHQRVGGDPGRVFEAQLEVVTSSCSIGVGTGDSSATGGGDRSSLEELRDLADAREAIALLLSGIEQVASERDQAVHTEYRLQRRLGDPNPADTVAALLDLNPANVRQIDSRVRRRMRDLTESDERYASLRDLAWLAA